jgi:hypothetical protein
MKAATTVSATAVRFLNTKIVKRFFAGAKGGKKIRARTLLDDGAAAGIAHNCILMKNP